MNKRRGGVAESGSGHRGGPRVVGETGYKKNGRAKTSTRQKLAWETGSGGLNGALRKAHDGEHGGQTYKSMREGIPEYPMLGFNVSEGIKGS